jgi:hypothetical protein
VLAAGAQLEADLADALLYAVLARRLLEQLLHMGALAGL